MRVIRGGPLALLLAALLLAAQPSSAQRSDVDPSLLEAVVAYDERRHDDARRLLDDVLKAQPGHLWALYCSGLVHLAQQRPAEAAAVLEKARALAPEQLAVLFQLGVAYFEQQRYDRAEPLLARVFEAQPTADGVGYYVGVMRYRRGDRRGALDAFQASATSDPAIEQLTRSYLGRVLHALRVPRRSAIDVQDGLGREPASRLANPLDALREIVLATRQRKRPPEAAWEPPAEVRFRPVRAAASPPGVALQMSLSPPPSPAVSAPPPLEPPALPPEPERPKLPLTLKESLLLALGRNLDIQVERLNPEIAATDIQRERGLFDPSSTTKLTTERLTKRVADPFFPNKNETTENLKGSEELAQKLPTGTTVTLTYEAADARDPPTTVGRHSAGATLKITQSLLRQLGLDVNLARIRIAEKSTAQARTDLVKRILDVVTDVQNTYWDLYRAARTVEIRRESYELSRSLFEQKRSEVELGVLAPVEIIDVQADLANKITEYVDALKTLQEIEVRFKALLNQSLDPADPSTAIEPTDGPSAGDRPLDVQTAVDEALRQRPEYRRLRLQAESKELEALVARRQLLPDLELNGSFSTNNLSHLNNFSSRYPWDKRTEERIGYEVGLKFVYTFGNNVARADLQRRLLELARTARELRLQEQTIKREVATAAVGVESGRNLVTSASNALALQERNIEAARQRLQFGVATIRDVIDIQSAYIEARLKHISSRTDLEKAFVGLYRAQGVIDPRFAIELNYD